MKVRVGVKVKVSVRVRVRVQWLSFGLRVVRVHVDKHLTLNDILHNKH